jgi:hypothetical protein
MKLERYDKEYDECFCTSQCSDHTYITKQADGKFVTYDDALEFAKAFALYYRGIKDGGLNVDKELQKFMEVK